MLIKLWARSLAWLGAIPDRELLLGEGIHEVRPGLYAVISRAADASLTESAYQAAQRFLLRSPPGAQVQVLMLPGVLRQQGSRLELVEEAAINDLEREAPRLESRIVHLTGYAVHELESRWELTDCGFYRGASGRQLPVWQLAKPQKEANPWRSPQLFGHTIQAVERTSLFDKLRQHSVSPAFVVSGPIGVGKTRAVWESLDSGTNRCLWARCWSNRSGGSSVAKQLLRHLLLSPQASGLPLRDAARLGKLRDSLSSWWRGESARDEERLTDRLVAVLDQVSGERRAMRLICDDVHAASPTDRATIDRLLELPGLGWSVQLVLVGRSGSAPGAAPWSTQWSQLPIVEVPPMTPGEASLFADHVLGGLSIPEEVHNRFLASSLGFPFALEEGLLQLIRRRMLRRRYGNFFFSGSSEILFEPSFRLVRHLESEIERLVGSSQTPIRALASVDIPVPTEVLEEIATPLDNATASDWFAPLKSAGIVNMVDSPWGQAPSFSCSALGRTVAATLSPEFIEESRERLGLALAERSQEGRSAWQAYQFVAGLPEAISPLLRAARSPSSGASREQLFEALSDELANLERRGGDPKLELALLWLLLPLARRLGRLRSIGTALDRALELAVDEPDKVLALTTLKAEHEQNEGRLQEAEICIVRGLKLAQSSDERRKALLFVQLGRLLQRQDRYPEARKLFEDCLPALDRAGNTSLGATCRFHLGNIALHENRLETAKQYHQEVLEQRRSQGLHHQLGSSLSAMGTVMLASGDYPQALAYFREAHQTLEEHGREGEVSFALLGGGRALSRLGDYTAASQPLRQALAYRQDKDDQTGEAIARLEVAENLLHLNHSEAALEEARKAHFRLSLSNAAKHLGDAEQLLGRIRLDQRHYQDAAEHFRTAIGYHQQHGDIRASTFDRAFLLEACLALSQEKEIERLCTDLTAVIETLRYPELGEKLDLRLYQGLEWLRQRGHDTDPLPPLRRAYQELYRKTELLSSDLRNRFLYQIDDNRRIINAATLHGLKP